MHAVTDQVQMIVLLGCSPQPEALPHHPTHQQESDTNRPAEHLSRRQLCSCDSLQPAPSLAIVPFSPPSVVQRFPVKEIRIRLTGAAHINFTDCHRV